MLEYSPLSPSSGPLHFLSFLSACFFTETEMMIFHCFFPLTDFLFLTALSRSSLLRQTHYYKYNYIT